MALCGEIVDFGRLNSLNKPDEVRGVGHIAVMQEEGRGMLMGIKIEIVDTFGVQ